MGDALLFFDPLFRHPAGVRSRWSNVNNIRGEAGRAGLDTRWLLLEPGRTLNLCEFDGPGIIDRLWITLDWPGKNPYPQSIRRNRSVIFECYWEEASEPAIRAPLGDFFCRPLGYDIPFENAFFSDPCGRSCQCFVPMPFRRHARILIHNHFDKPITVYHAAHARQGVELRDEDGYLHACWRRSLPGPPGRAHEILPRIDGAGRFLGMHLGLLTDPVNPLNWNDSEIDFFLDQDVEHPSIRAPSLDDYCGSSWDYDRCFMHRDGGMLQSRYFPDGSGHHAYYVYHRRDPLYFHESCRILLRPGFGDVISRICAGLDREPALADHLALPETIAALRKKLAAGKDAWVRGLCCADVSSLALFYLNRPDGAHSQADDLNNRCEPGWAWPPEDESNDGFQPGSSRGSP